MLGHKRSYEGQYEVMSGQGLRQVSQFNSDRIWAHWVKSGHISVCQVKLGYVRSIQVMSGQIGASWVLKCQLRSCQLNLVHNESLHSSSKVMFCQAGHVGSRWVTMGQEGSCRVHLGHVWLNQVTLGQVRSRWDTTGQGKANTRSSC